MKKMINFVLALSMMMSLCATPTFAADTTKHYTIDLNTATEREWNDCRVSLSFLLNGNEKVNAFLGENYSAEYQPYWNETMGYPVLLNYTIDETTKQKMAITWVPIRLICDCLSTPIEWVPKTDTEEAHAVITTANGPVKLYVNATQIEYTDDQGQVQVYEETTYRFPDNTPIPLCLVRQNRIYVPVRAISTFLLDSSSVRFDWRRADYLQITANTKGTTLQKTPGINMNYYNEGNWSMNWSAMPNLMAALEGTDWVMDNQNTPELPSDGVFMYTKGAISHADITLAITYVYNSTGTGKVLKITGYDYTETYSEQLPVIEGALKDLICDADRESIMGLLNEIADTMSVGYTPTQGTTQMARDWRTNFQKSYILNEVKVQFNEYLKEFTITTK